MTRILTSREITRETEEQYTGRPLIVRLRPRSLDIWPKGQPNRGYRLKYGAAYEAAKRLAARYGRRGGD